MTCDYVIPSIVLFFNSIYKGKITGFCGGILMHRDPYPLQFPIVS